MIGKVSIADIVCLVLKSICEPNLEELRAHIAFGLLHDVLVAQLRLDILDPLHVGIGYLTILVTVALFDFLRPLDAVELQVKVQYEY